MARKEQTRALKAGNPVLMKPVQDLDETETGPYPYLQMTEKHISCIFTGKEPSCFRVMEMKCIFRNIKPKSR